MTSKIEKTYCCTILHDSVELLIRVPTQSRGVRELAIRLNAMDEAGLSSEEQSLVYSLSDGLEGEQTTHVLSVPDLRSIAAIREKIQSIGQPAPSPAPTAPATTYFSPEKSLVGERERVTVSANSSLKSTNRAIHEGVRFRTTSSAVDAMERRVRQLQKVTDIFAGEFWQLEYDIPERVAHHPRAEMRVQNPSGWFWKHGMRMTGSCWIFAESDFQHHNVAGWMEDAKKKGCKIRVIKYAKDQIQTVKQIAEEELRLYLVELHTGLIENIGRADQRLSEAKAALLLPSESDIETKTSQQLEDARNNRVRQVIGGACRTMEVAIESAEKYDVSEKVSDLLDALRAAIVVQATDFNRIAREKGIKLATLPE